MRKIDHNKRRRTTNPKKNLIIIVLSHMSHDEFFGLEKIKFTSPNSNHTKQN